MGDRTTNLATHDLDAVVVQALAWQSAGRKVALATVARTWGSSPRPAGSKLAVSDAAEFVGSVSGGCIEGAVIHDALEVMESGVSRMLAFGVSDEIAVMAKGVIVHRSETQAFRRDPATAHRLLGVEA